MSTQILGGSTAQILTQTSNVIYISASGTDLATGVLLPCYSGLSAAQILATGVPNVILISASGTTS